SGAEQRRRAGGDAGGYAPAGRGRGGRAGAPGRAARAGTRRPGIGFATIFMTMAPGGSILLVDDEEKILKNLSRALRDEGHDVVPTTSAREAQRLLAERTFDLMVVDNRMPERSGLDVIRELVSS